MITVYRFRYHNDGSVSYEKHPAFKIGFNYELTDGTILREEDFYKPIISDNTTAYAKASGDYTQINCESDYPAVFRAFYRYFITTAIRYELNKLCIDNNDSHKENIFKLLNVLNSMPEVNVNE